MLDTPSLQQSYAAALIGVNASGGQALTAAQRGWLEDRALMLGLPETEYGLGGSGGGLASWFGGGGGGGGGEAGGEKGGKGGEGGVGG